MSSRLPRLHFIRLVVNRVLRNDARGSTREGSSRENVLPDISFRDLLDGQLSSSFTFTTSEGEGQISYVSRHEDFELSFLMKGETDASTALSEGQRRAEAAAANGTLSFEVLRELKHIYDSDASFKAHVWVKERSGEKVLRYDPALLLQSRRGDSGAASASIINEAHHSLGVEAITRTDGHGRIVNSF
eukprot:644759-Pleurochrysis_carterae.AAC.2